MQTEEYKALMARLRREEEERTYERMTQKAGGPTREPFGERYPGADARARAFAAVNQPSKAADLGSDDWVAEYGDVQKQVTLILNFLVSIVGSGVALWLAARWWSTPARLFLSLGGSLLVAVAEVAVYSAYSWRMAEGERRENEKREVREVAQTWVVGASGGEEEEDEKTETLKGGGEKDDGTVLAPSAPPRPVELENLEDAISNLRRRMKDPSS